MQSPNRRKPDAGGLSWIPSLPNPSPPSRLQRGLHPPRNILQTPGWLVLS